MNIKFSTVNMSAYRKQSFICLLSECMNILIAKFNLIVKYIFGDL